MAGSFGYEKEHYDISMQMGEDILYFKSATIVSYLLQQQNKLSPSKYDGTIEKHNIHFYFKSCFK
jgi:hypothetical protein